MVLQLSNNQKKMRMINTLIANTFKKQITPQLIAGLTLTQWMSRA